jgi:hypothetical protein
MNLCRDKDNVPAYIKMRVLAVMNSIHNFISGERFFQNMLNLTQDEYISMVKETLKFILIPAFTIGERRKKRD